MRTGTLTDVIYPFPVQHVGGKPWKLYRRLFSEPECRRILRLAPDPQRITAMTPGRPDLAMVDQGCGRLSVDEWEWVYVRMNEAFLDYNYDHGFTLTGWTEEIRVLTYEFNQQHGWHTDYDLTADHDYADLSKVSCITQLSDPRKALGGSLELLNEKTPVMGQGDAIVLAGHLGHRRAVVQSGVHVSMVGFLTGPQYR